MYGSTHGRMTNTEIVRLFGVNCAPVTQQRRRLRMLAEEDRKVKGLLRAFEDALSFVAPSCHVVEGAGYSILSGNAMFCE